MEHHSLGYTCLQGLARGDLFSYLNIPDELTRTLKFGTTLSSDGSASARYFMGPIHMSSVGTFYREFSAFSTSYWFVV